MLKAVLLADLDRGGLQVGHDLVDHVAHLVVSEEVVVEQQEGVQGDLLLSG